MFGLIAISVVFGLIGSLVSNRLKSKFAQYAQIPTSSGMSGREVAERMLQHYNIQDVEIVQGQGRLTDHYNPKTEAYTMLQFRSAIVPLVQLSSNLQQYFFMFAFMMAGALGNSLILMIAVALFGVTALFSLITLPVEFDASSRALAWLDTANVTRGAEYDGAKDALKWAAMTYVVGALAAVAQLLYFLMIFLASDD